MQFYFPVISQTLNSLEIPNLATFKSIYRVQKKIYLNKNIISMNHIILTGCI